MKNYKTPELNITMIAEIGDVITSSHYTFDDNKARLGTIGSAGEDCQIW